MVFTLQDVVQKMNVNSVEHIQEVCVAVCVAEISTEVNMLTDSL